MQVVLILASLLIIGVSADQQPPSVEAVNSQPGKYKHAKSSSTWNKYKQLTV